MMEFKKGADNAHSHSEIAREYYNFILDFTQQKTPVCPLIKTKPILYNLYELFSIQAYNDKVIIGDGTDGGYSEPLLKALVILCAVNNIKIYDRKYDD